MTNEPENSTVLISGRVFTPQKLQEIKETVRLFPQLSRKELAKTICEHLSWVTPNGQYKTACVQALEKLAARGTFVLPAKKNTSRFTGEKIILGTETEARTEIAGSAGDFAPLNWSR